jgi:hypothetical protein
MKNYCYKCKHTDGVPIWKERMHIVCDLKKGWYGVKNKFSTCDKFESRKPMATMQEIKEINNS